MRRVLFFAGTGLILATGTQARLGLHAIACIGEISYPYGYDMAGTTALTQAGFTLEYRTRLLALYNSPTLGYYTGRPVLEDYLGVELGWDIAWARPALTGGIGVQSYYRKDFRGQSDAFDRKFELKYPLGLGFRLWLFRSFYGEWQGRMWNREKDGIPAWKMEFGYRIR